MKKLKVWTCCADGINNLIVATYTKKRAMELMNISPFCFSNYGHETGNKIQLAVCLANPEIVFKQKCSSNEQPTPVIPNLVINAVNYDRLITEMENAFNTNPLKNLAKQYYDTGMRSGDIYGNEMKISDVIKVRFVNYLRDLELGINNED